MHLSPPNSEHLLSATVDDLQGLARDNDIWYEDGNIVLQTDTTLFCVYSGLLAARSSVFKDMLAFPQPSEGNPSLDGCPVVRMYDSTEDVQYFLNAMLDSSYFEPPPTPTELHIVAGILRLSIKYDVQYLRRRALQHLSVTFPSTLDGWHLREKTRTIPPVNNTPFAALRIAREFDLQWLIPSLMYCICSHPLLKSVDGTEWAGQTIELSPDDKRIALLGREKLLMYQNRYSLNLSMPPDEKGLCTSSEECSSTRSRVPHIITGWMVACYLDFCREHTPLLVSGLCKGCHAYFVNKFEVMSRELWQVLPVFFGLPGWEELERLRSKALE